MVLHTNLFAHKWEQGTLKSEVNNGIAARRVRGWGHREAISRNYSKDVKLRGIKDIFLFEIEEIFPTLGRSFDYV